MNRKLTVKRMVGVASLAAIVIVLQLIAGFLPKLPGGLSLSLTLVPIIVGAILYGVYGGAFLGLTMAIMVLLDPSTSVFYEANIIATIIIVLLKSTLAGAISGLVFKLLYKKSFIVALFLASVLCPVINTGIFTVGASLFFKELFGGGLWIIIGSVGANFLVELGINVVLCPTIAVIIKSALSNYDLGTNLDKDEDYYEGDEEE